MNRYAWARRQLDRCHDCGETPRLKARGDLYKVYCPVCLRGHRSQYVSLTAAVKGWNTPEQEWAPQLVEENPPLPKTAHYADQYWGAEGDSRDGWTIRKWHDGLLVWWPDSEPFPPKLKKLKLSEKYEAAWLGAIDQVSAEEFVSEIDGRDSRQSPEDPGEREEAVL